MIGLTDETLRAGARWLDGTSQPVLVVPAEDQPETDPRRHDANRARRRDERTRSPPRRHRHRPAAPREPAGRGRRRAVVRRGWRVGPGRAAKKSIQKDRRIVVSWKGEQKRRIYQKTANVPGIGAVDLVCRPNSTQVRIRPNSRSAETQLWMAKFETKGGRDVVAVKNVRVYTYATAADDGRGGTGAQAHEGLNQRTPIEDFQKGNAYGVISQRPGRNQPGQGALTTPATSFKLTWWWERFDYPGHQYCKMALDPAHRHRAAVRAELARQRRGRRADHEHHRRSPGSATPIVTLRDRAATRTTRRWRSARPGPTPRASFLDYELHPGRGRRRRPRRARRRPRLRPGHRPARPGRPAPQRHDAALGLGRRRQAGLRALVLLRRQQRPEPGAQHRARSPRPRCPRTPRHRSACAHQVEHRHRAGLDVGDRHPRHGVGGAVELGEHAARRRRRR